VNAICSTCGAQFPDTLAPPSTCAICLDERQYVGLEGQHWTTLDELRLQHKTKIEAEEPSLSSFWIEPRFAIGQRAFLLQNPAGAVLWDCISLLDDAALDFIRRSGGLSAIAISHPHYYTCMVEWSRAFGNIPIYLHKDDARWVMRPDPCIEFWEGETKILPGGLILIRCGGHFDGGTVLHWPSGAGGSGALLTGDIIQVVPDRRFVSFMYSYPNYIPLGAAAVRRIVNAVEPLPFDRIYGAFPGLTVTAGARAALKRSAERYLKAIQ
jgi:glyoxylase-like metal-dependent hydrolase (beta-lactamase superfamily II)